MFSRSMVMAALLGLLAALCWPASARAQGAVVGKAVDVCVARAEPGMTAREMVTARLSRFDCTTPQTEFGHGDFWVVTRAMPGGLGTGRSLYVRSNSLWQRAMTLYALYPDGAIGRARIDDVGASKRLQLGTVIQQQLINGRMPPVRLAWHVEGAANVRGIIVSPRIANATERTGANLLMASLYAGFAGIMLALLVHNTAMWRVLRQRFQLWYLAMLGALALYGFAASGVMAWVLPGHTNTGRLQFSYVALALTGTAAIGFSRSFFEPAVFRGWLNRLAIATAGTLLGAAALIVVAGDAWVPLLDQVYSIALLMLVGLAIPIVIRARRQKSRFLVPWLLTWTAPYLLCGLRVAQNFRLFEWRFWVENSTLLAMTLEALGASLAIAYRVRLLARERDAARAEELAARLLADADPLTGLLNRRAFLDRAIGRPGPQTLLIVDLDRFKSVNDTIGHDGGDEVLRRVARVLRETCPDDCLATRFGGEEFAVLCPAGSPVTPDDILARLRETRMPFDLTITASIGACTGPLENEIDWKALYRAADRGLYAAKNAGRDRARTIESPRAYAA